MRASIAIASHNEGDRLGKTIESCLESIDGLDYEIVVADDASTDGSLAQLRKRFPRVRLITRRKRLGTSPTKDMAARASRGKVIVFLDGHCKPEPGAVRRLVEDVEDLDGRAIITPAVPALDCERWTNNHSFTGQVFWVKLEDFSGAWLSNQRMPRQRRFHETPGLIGCALAVSRKLYEELRGFDLDMLQWGIEDLDLGLKAWLLGYSVLNDPKAVIGHRFRSSFDNFLVTSDCVLLNKLRAARKTFTEATWKVWLEYVRSVEPERVWNRGWRRFQKTRSTVEREREYLLARRRRDEFWFSERFGLAWPQVSAPQSSSADGARRRSGRS